MTYNSWPWPEHYGQEESIAKQELIKHICPVCKSDLGDRLPSEEKRFHCSDCRALYTWYPGVDKPSAILDKDMPQLCGCGGCRISRGEA